MAEQPTPLSDLWSNEVGLVAVRTLPGIEVKGGQA
jgi:hypothetical protein